MKRLLPVLMGFALLLLSSTEGWSLPPCPTDSHASTWTDCFGTYTFASGSKYVGEFKDGKYYGQGTYNLVDGENYVGEFKDDKRHGQGTVTFDAPHKSAGAKYVGEWKDNKGHGQGIYTFASGDKYVGEYRNNKRNGQGTYTFASGDKYVGEFKDGTYHGQGTYTYADGRVNEGIWENGKFLSAKKSTPTVTAKKTCPGNFKPTWDNCIGTRTFSDKSRYTGQWKSGKQHGQGTLTYADGEKYVGGFRDGLHHGEGTITYANGKTLKGIWENDKFKNDKFLSAKKPSPTVTATTKECPSSPSSSWTTIGNWTDCFGIHNLPNGNKYVGEYRDGNLHGHGTYTHASGNKYVGGHKDGKRHGQGTYYYLADNKFKGDKYVGEYRDGKRHGRGTFTVGNLGSQGKYAGDKYVGEWKDGEYHGQGTYTYASGDKYVGEYKDSKRTGHGTYTYASGSKYVGEYKDGKRTGHGTYTFASGSKYVGEYRDDKKNGQGTYTFADGRKEVGAFKDGQFHGQGIRYHADGRVFQEGIFENGKFLYARKPSPTVTAKKRPHSDNEKTIPAASGTGFAVSTSGHVVTNYHVIEGCSDVKIHHKGNVIPSTVVTHDPINDLALLKGNFRPGSIFTLSRKNPQLMQEIFVAGYPFGNKINTSVKVTKGIVSSLTGIGNNISNIQIDAALQPGNSGGPIFNDEGNVVAVAVAKLDLKTVMKKWGVIPENTNFGIKSNVVVNLLESNNVDLEGPRSSTISKIGLGKIISDATYYLSCWMTMAQIEKMKSKKTIFRNLD